MKSVQRSCEDCAHRNVGGCHVHAEKYRHPITGSLSIHGRTYCIEWMRDRGECGPAGVLWTPRGSVNS